MVMPKKPFVLFQCFKIVYHVNIIEYHFIGCFFGMKFPYFKDALTYGEYVAALTSKDKSNNSKSKKKKLKEKGQVDADEGQLDQFLFLEEIGLEWSIIHTYIKGFKKLYLKKLCYYSPVRFTQRSESIKVNKEGVSTPATTTTTTTTGTSTSTSTSTTPMVGSSHKTYPNSGGWSPLSRTLGSIASTLTHPTASTSTTVSTTSDEMTLKRPTATHSYVKCIGNIKALFVYITIVCCII